MDDKDFDVHVVNEHRYRAKQEETLAANKTGVAPPAMKKAMDVAGNAVSALGSGVYDILNPIHKDEEGQIDWGKTGVHAAVEAPAALYLAGKATGMVKKGYDSMVGVNPTIAAQNATKELTQKRQIEHDERMLAAKNKAASDLAASKAQQQSAKQTSPQVQQKVLSPQDQYFADIYNKQQADKNFSGQPQQQSPAAANVEARPPSYSASTIKAGAEANVAHNQQQILANRAAQAEGGGYARAPGSAILTPTGLQSNPISKSIDLQRGGLNINAISEAGSNIAGAVKPALGQAGSIVGSQVKGAAATLPFMLATDVRAQNEGYRKELEQQLKNESDANRISELKSELKKLDQNTYINAMTNRYVNRNIPVQFRPQ